MEDANIEEINKYFGNDVIDLKSLLVSDIKTGKVFDLLNE